VKILKWNKDK